MLHWPMSVSNVIKLYFLTIPIFLVIDLLWLGVIAKSFYRRHLSNLLSDEVNWPAAIIFYLIFIAGIILFAVLPAIEKNSFVKALIMGALFGFFTYATYDLTNLATLRGWPVIIVFVDICWGMVLTGSVASAGYLIAKRLM